MKVYYARPISLYNTPQDERNVKLLESLGFEVNNPDKAELVERYKTEGMEVYFKLVRESDAVAFAAFVDGKIGAGVMGELQVAIDAGKPVIEIPTFLPSRVLTVDETRTYLRYLGKR